MACRPVSICSVRHDEDKNLYLANATRRTENNSFDHVDSLVRGNWTVATVRAVVSSGTTC
jgi:hypothetical protein